MKFSIENPHGYLDYRIPNPVKNYRIWYLISQKEEFEILKRKDEKSVVFVSNKKRGEELCEKLEQENIKVLFVTAENKEEAGAEAVNSLVQNCTFSADVLIATSVLDVGINIKDKRVTTVILDAYERNTFIQMLGRIRLLDEQCINVFIFQRNIKFFDNVCEKSLIPRLEFQRDIASVKPSILPSKIAKMMQENRESVDCAAFCYCKGMIKLNPLTRQKLVLLYSECLDTKNGLADDPDYFIKKQLRWMGMEDSFDMDNYVSQDIKKDRIAKLISLIEASEVISCREGVGKEEMHKFLQTLIQYIRGIDNTFLRSTEVFSIKKFNQFCQLQQLPFKVVQRQDKTTRKQVYWLINCNAQDAI